jgi:hypothetical protein
MEQQRISIAVSSAYNAALINKWAEATGRPLSGLGAYLLEKGLETALKEGIVPAEIVSSVNGDFFSGL